ncbi:HAMP domain-containing sensor histidine kinase [Streptomyces zingiberis]|uniref:Signal transduction histidine-protein kinase/phosphatase MprB n=1 Tax=Streptomyces zingiberis TaxID=2053010 RepID=A0ABX1BYC3_9ACTN|nr:HAMP domain-containing sensor histidine kinase [Streptomyces zingiberis]NJQ02631.1 HAMP domain-containing histidine kinase [Streptomyces zingiberis]
MRRALAGVALAVTSMVALSFLIPLALLVQSEARDRSTTEAEQRASALAPVLALSTRSRDVQQAVSALDPGRRLAVHLPDGEVIGTRHAPASALARAGRERATLALDTDEGWVYLQPVILAGDRVAVVESFVPRAALNRGVTLSWVVMSLLAVGLVAGSVLVADRLGARVVRSSRELSRAAHALGGGDLGVRVEPAGPPELQEAGRAFNSMADRVTGLLATERELVADLSHRLRTPLTALRLEAERLGPAPGSERLARAVTQLRTELDSIISAARTPLAVNPPGAGAAHGGEETGNRCEVSAVVRERVEFWRVLAGQQDRSCRLVATAEPTPVRLGHDDLAAVVDALIGNVFQHTPEGTAFAVEVERTAQAVVLSVDDAGPGIADPDLALARGVSVGGSTGLGLDIAHRAARATRGDVTIGRGPLGGARVRVTLGLAAAGAPAGTGSRASRAVRAATRRGRRARRHRPQAGGVPGGTSAPDPDGTVRD